MAAFDTMKTIVAFTLLNIVLTTCEIIHTKQKLHSLSVDKQEFEESSGDLDHEFYGFSGDKDYNLDVSSGDKQEFEESSGDFEDEIEGFSGDKDDLDASSGDKEFEESSGDKDFEEYSGDDSNQIDDFSGNQENEVDGSGDGIYEFDLTSKKEDITYGIDLSWSPSWLPMSGMGLFCQITS